MKVYVCEVDYGYDGTRLARVFGNEEEAKKWEKDCYNLRAEYLAYVWDWTEQYNPSHGLI